MSLIFYYHQVQQVILAHVSSVPQLVQDLSQLLDLPHWSNKEFVQMQGLSGVCKETAAFFLDQAMSRVTSSWQSHYKDNQINYYEDVTHITFVTQLGNTRSQRDVQH